MEEEDFEFEERMARRAMLVERIVRYAVGIAVLAVVGIVILGLFDELG